MYKKTITYEDYNGVTRTEDFYFNLTEAELTELQLGVKGGYAEMIQKMVDAKDVSSLIGILKDLIIRSYGVKSDDGRRFIKKPEITEEFTETPAYSALYMELATDDKKASAFINGIIPAKLAAQVEKNKVENSTVTGIPSNT